MSGIGCAGTALNAFVLNVEASSAPEAADQAAEARQTSEQFEYLAIRDDVDQVLAANGRKASVKNSCRCPP